MIKFVAVNCDSFSIKAYFSVPILVSFQHSEDEWVEAPALSGGVDKAWKAEHEATPTGSSASANQVRSYSIVAE